VIARCPSCAENFPVLGSSRQPCPFCGAQLEIVIHRLTTAGEDSSAIHDVPSVAKIAWDDRERPFPSRFLTTLKDVLAHPRVFFRAAGEGNLRGPIVFALLLFIPAILIQGLAAYFALTAEAWPFGWPARREVSSAALPRFFALAPITAVLFIAYLASFYQAATAIASGRRPELHATIRGTCFGFAPMILAVIPFVGLVAGLSWSIALHAIALRELHGLGRFRALLVVLLPLVVIALHIVYEAS
jgi:hypothetical protein